MVINRIKEFVDGRKMTVYHFRKLTEVSEPTAYRLYNDPCLVPSGNVLEAIYRAFPETTPNDWLAFVSEDEAKKLKNQLARIKARKQQKDAA